MSSFIDSLTQFQDKLSSLIERADPKQIDGLEKLKHLQVALAQIVTILRDPKNDITEVWIINLYQDSIYDIEESIGSIFKLERKERIKTKIKETLPRLRSLIFGLYDIVKINKADSCIRLDDELKQLQQTANGTVEEIQETKQTSIEEKETIEEVKSAVGTLQEEITQSVTGSKDLLDKVEKQFNEVETLCTTADSHVKASQKEFEKLTQKVEKLAPSLAAATLSERYNNYADKYEKQSKNLFWITICAGFVSAILIYIAVFYSPATTEIAKSHSYFAWGVESLIKITLSVFLIYVTVFISRIYNRSRNLMEEYRHKSAISDSYTGLMKYLQEQKEEEEDNDNPEVLQEIKSAIAELANVYIEQLAISPGEVHLTHSLKKDSNFTSSLFKKFSARISKNGAEIDAQS